MGVAEGACNAVSHGLGLREHKLRWAQWLLLCLRQQKLLPVRAQAHLPHFRTAAAIGRVSLPGSESCAVQRVVRLNVDLVRGVPLRNFWVLGGAELLRISAHGGRLDRAAQKLAFTDILDQKSVCFAARFKRRNLQIVTVAQRCHSILIWQVALVLPVDERLISIRIIAILPLD